jgi:hypothetical protein
MSGDAVREHKKPQEALVESITWPVEDMLNRCLKQISDASGISDSPKVVGLGGSISEDDVEELKEMIDNGRYEAESGTSSGTDEERTEAERGSEDLD